MSLFYKSISLAVVFLGVTGGVSATELSTQDQRLSYVLGYQFAQQLKAEGVTVDIEAFSAAVDDVVAGKPLQMTLEEMRESLRAGQEAIAEKKAAEAQAALEQGQRFLEQNRSQEGVVTLPSGLQYIELTPGAGESPAADAKVTVHYRGTLINGKEFDSSYRRGEPTSFSLAGVIPGFRESITLMKPGAKWKVFIPAELGYGVNGAGSDIGPNETLIFDIELLSVE
ncbi:MAG: FKBP-type peptidyl-prolyl cis-trans isomerase [Gammaproteobacteria bacterium]|nr:FKBP-type peptidyl-prolyl cis-trans isomerase [Gammaproteobacteria bacterium]